MAAAMQPRMATVTREERQAVLAQGLTAMGAPLRPRSRRRIPPLPFGNAACKRSALRVAAREAAVVLGNAGPLVEKRLPVVRVPC